MIDVRLFATLPGKTESGRRSFEVEARPGLTVEDVARVEGLTGEDVHIAMVNGVRADLDAELSDGDRVGLFPPVGGG